MDERSALLYAKLHSYTRLVNRTHGFIRWALARVKTPYVACSFGKDSAVMLHMVLEHAPDIKVIFNKWKHESDLIHNYNEIIKWWTDNYAINLQIIEFSRTNIDMLLKSRFKHVRDYDAYDSYFLGLRSDESKARKISLKYHGNFYINKEEKTRICPLHDWTTKDIATYTLVNKIKSLWDYEKYGFEARTTARIPTDSEYARQMWISQFKREKPSEFNALCKIFPELKFYA